MSETHTDSDSDKLRAFEKKMHDEGAAGFADGPSPWETWDDDSGLLKNNRVWEGSSRRIYPGKRAQQSLGDRVLSGLAMLSLATMVVGIAGVYFSDPQSGQVVATGIQPLPIDRSPSATDSAVAKLAQLPAPAAGTTKATAAPDSDSFTVAPPAPLHQPAPIAVVAAPAASIDAAPPARNTGIDAAAPQDSTANEPGSRPAPSTSAAPDIESAGSAAISTAPLAAMDSSTTTGAANTAARPASPAATDKANVATSEAAVTAEDTVAATAAPPRIATPATEPDAVATLAGQPTLPGSVAAAAPGTVAVATAAAEPGTVVQPAIATLEADRVDAAPTADMNTLPGSAEESPVAQTTGIAAEDTPAEPVATVQSEPAVTTAAAGPAIAKTETGVADTVAGLEALPVPMAGPGDTAEAPASVINTTTPPHAAQDTQESSMPAAMPDPDKVVAAAEPVTSTTAPAEAVQQITPAVKTGDWVVNLASYTRESTASRMLTRFRDKGVDAELVTVMINDKPMHRLRVSGFASSRAAKARIKSLEQQLDLEGVWISRK